HPDPPLSPGVFQVLAGVCVEIELLVLVEVLRESVGLSHPVQAKCAVVLPQATVSNEVPSAPPTDQTIWLHHPAGELIALRPIGDLHALPCLDRLTKENE